MVETEVITIDGPTSSGKNSVGFLLAQKLGYQYIDSGSIYRAACIFILREKIPLDDLGKIVKIFRNLQIEIQTPNNKQRFIANGEDVTNYLHNAEITKIVSQVAAIKEVRQATKIIQDKLVNTKNTVMTGRDIGSEIFPNAQHKFFLTASPEVRAKRRFAQLKKVNPNLTLEQVLQDMLIRDQADSERKVSPMRIAKDAIVIDNSNLTVDETVGEMLKYIQSYA